MERKFYHTLKKKKILYVRIAKRKNVISAESIISDPSSKSVKRIGYVLMRT